MIDLAKDAAAIDITDLLTRYSFDLGGSTLDRWVDAWLDRYPVQWVRLAVIEALYQGRYKAISVEQLLVFWQRRSKTLYHFTHEFERIICGRFPQHRIPPQPRSLPPRSPLPPQATPVRSPFTPLAASSSQTTPSTPTPAAATPPVQQPADISPSEENAIEEMVAAAAESTTALEPPADLAEPPEALTGELPEEQTEGQTPAQLSNADSDADIDSTFRPIDPHSPVTPFKPTDPEAIELAGSLEDSEDSVWERHNPEPIHQFIPVIESSDFYSKLRAVALSTAGRTRSDADEEVDISHLTPRDRG